MHAFCISQKMIRSNKTITMKTELKSGDPFVFGRGGEEVLYFREFGVEPSIIPVSRV